MILNYSTAKPDFEWTQTTAPCISQTHWRAHILHPSAKSWPCRDGWFARCSGGAGGGGAPGGPSISE
jgi:hypothetical protein